jgi:hypothetical protein
LPDSGIAQAGEQVQRQHVIDQLEGQILVSSPR